MPFQPALLKTRQALFLISAVLQIGWTAAFADIAPAPLSGGENLENKAVKPTMVAMVDEVVKLRVTRDACYVNVVFTMTNMGEAAETMSVGFPFFRPDELKDFKAAIDDKPVVVTNEKGGQLRGGGLDAPAGWAPYWKLWQMTFPPGKPVKIAVLYTTKLSSAPWSWNPELTSVPQELAMLVPEKERLGFAKQFEVRRVTYILRTGSRWAGPIGRCRIEVSFDGMTTDNLTLNGLNFEKEQAVISPNTIAWDLKDYEPTYDVEFTITPFITRKAMLQLLERLQKPDSLSAVLSAMQVEYLNTAGRQQEAEETLLQFLNKCRDKVVIWGPRDQKDLTLEDSVKVYNMIRQIVDPQKPGKVGSLEDRMDPRAILPTFRPSHPEAFVPAIQRIAQRVNEQMKHIPPASAFLAKDYATNLDMLLDWCQKLTD